ncbi:MAG: ribonuclease HII [Saprospiraceae bacterium]
MLLPYHSSKNEAGCDEAGRGCLAGPVFGAAVILPHDFENPDLNDSKKLSKIQRLNLRKIIEKEAIAFSVGMVSHIEIDKINILQASIRSMLLALSNIEIPFDHIIVDGNKFLPYKSIPHTCVIKGDSKYLSIAAASILAKTYRDDYMEKLHKKFPLYGWNQNKGYPTVKHRMAIKEYGTTPFHRMTFRLLPECQ